MSNNPNSTNPLNTQAKSRISISDVVRLNREADHAARLEERGVVWSADPYVWKQNMNPEEE